MSLQPAHGIIGNLGGASKVAAALDVSYSQVRKWTWSKARGGTGGIIPQRHHVPILDLARRLDVPMTAADFLPVAHAAPCLAAEPARASV